MSTKPAWISWCSPLDPAPADRLSGWFPDPRLVYSLAGVPTPSHIDIRGRRRKGVQLMSTAKPSLLSLENLAAFLSGGDAGLPPNEPRYDRQGEGGHVESYFLRANHPTERKAIWLKATVFMPTGRRWPSDSGQPAEATADAWCVYFDGDARRSWAHRKTIPLPQARIDRGIGDQVGIDIGGCTFGLGSQGQAQGALNSTDGPCEWALEWRSDESLIGQSLSIFPHPAMVSGPFPKSKLLTPFPLAWFSGVIRCFGQEIEVKDWVGMQGHNWGREHAWEYAWGQCLFVDENGGIDCMAEGFSSRIRLAGRVTPRFSALVVRRAGREYRFDHVFDFWRQEAALDDTSWTLRLTSKDGEARLAMFSEPDMMVCLGYRNPAGCMAYCTNSKLARTDLRVTPVDDEPFECRSAHGGALEFLRREKDPRFNRAV